MDARITYMVIVELEGILGQHTVNGYLSACRNARTTYMVILVLAGMLGQHTWSS